VTTGKYMHTPRASSSSGSSSRATSTAPMAATSRGRDPRAHPQADPPTKYLKSH